MSANNRLSAIVGIGKRCDSCIISKQKRSPFPCQAKYSTGKHIELIHGDLCGPIKPETLGKRMMFLLLVDDMSRFMWIKLLRTKSEAVEATKQVQAQAEAESGQQIHVLRTDCGGEFTFSALEEYCDNLSIQRHLTAPYTPQ
jgi:hypothetical protein